MNTKLFLIALTAFLGVSQFANAGVMLLVHFGTTEVTKEEELVKNYTPNGEKSITANYYLQLTGGDSVYAYRFSVKFSENLEFTGFEQTRPAGLMAQLREPNTGPEPLDDPSVDNGILKRFSGIDPNFYHELKVRTQLIDLGINTEVSRVVRGDGFYKLGSTTFNISKTLSPGEPLVQPGRFDAILDTNDIGYPGYFDDFGSDDFGVFFPQVDGGNVSISTVPEPTSLMAFAVLATLGVIAGKRRFK